MVAQVLTLAQYEPVRLDPTRLDELYDRLGEENADNVICRAIEELALRISECERQWRKNDWTALRKSARSLVAIADQIGMSALARVAQDVAGTAERRDMVASGATLFRLIRIGERSLTAIWDGRDPLL